MLHPIIKEYASSKAKTKLEKKYKEITEKIEEATKRNKEYTQTDEEINIISRFKSFDSNIDSECKAWILDISNQAEQRSFSTHIPKFINPDINKFSNIIVLPNRQNDGYIKTANVTQFIDSSGNAAAMPTTDLMSLEINGEPLYVHLSKDTDVAKEFIEFFGGDGTIVKENFMKMISPENKACTDARARQVFFPTENLDGYHIITPLMSSPVMNQLSTTLNKNRRYINNPTNSDTKTPQRARDFEKENKYLEGGYWTLTDTVNINYGGTKPQNISNFNNRAKTMKLLKSLPPQLRHRKIRIPLNSFFSDSVYIKADRYSCIFTELDKIFKATKNDTTIRELRNKYMLSLLEEIATDISSVRNEIELNEGDYRGSLDQSEYIMLYEDEKRYEDDKWLMDISEKFSRWFFNSYIKIANSPIFFGDAEYRYVRDFIFKNKEMFIQ